MKKILFFVIFAMFASYGTSSAEVCSCAYDNNNSQVCVCTSENNTYKMKVLVNSLEYGDKDGDEADTNKNKNYYQQGGCVAASPVNGSTNSLSTNIRNQKGER